MNWADVPGVTTFENGALLAYWLVSSEGGYEVHYATAKGEGATFEVFTAQSFGEHE